MPVWVYGAANEPVSRGAGQVAIASVHYNAAGDDNENLNDEYITIRNSGTTTADLTSWQVRDSDGFVYTLPSVTLSSRESLKVHTGRWDAVCRGPLHGFSGPCPEQ